jgi:DNA invertase Pin-like site-specific DNA recombinase
MARIGYARVSTIDQDLDIQLGKLKAEGCDIVRAEKASGGSREGRNELATVIEFLRPGDELVVTRLDRLGRDTRDVLNLIHECEQRGAFVTVLDPHVTTRGEMGHLILTKASGKYRGGKRQIDHERILALLKAGAGPSAVAKSVGCSRMQVYRVRKGAEPSLKL